MTSTNCTHMKIASALASCKSRNPASSISMCCDQKFFHYQVCVIYGISIYNHGRTHCIYAVSIQWTHGTYL